MNPVMRRTLAAALYHLVAKRLPPSYSKLQLGQTKLRRFCGKQMMVSCGEQVNIEQHALFSAKVTLGDYSGIGIHARIDGTCHIGSRVMMGRDCIVITRNHRYDRTDLPMMLQGFEEERPVVIGDDVWIGDRVTILPGVHIGCGAVIGAGAVVTKDVPPCSVAVGNPARVIGRRGQEEAT